MNIVNFLLAVQQVGTALIANSPAVYDIFQAAKSVLTETDQEEAQSILEDLIADREEGHARLQAKLAEAAQNT
jgi:hypothetical protein